MGGGIINGYTHILESSSHYTSSFLRPGILRQSLGKNPAVEMPHCPLILKIPQSFMSSGLPIRLLSKL